MPLELADNFKPPWFLRNPHSQTMLVNVLRQPKLPKPIREKIVTSDDDFHYIDRYQQGSRKCIIVSHGLEGDSQRQYTRGLIRCMYEAGWDGIGFNFRSCGGEMNKFAKAYHCGATFDLKDLVEKLVREKQYEVIVLAGFSLGGNVSLLSGAEWGQNIPEAVKAIIATSVPMDLTTCVPQIEHPRNWPYLSRFMSGLKTKALEKIDAGIMDEQFRPLVLRSKNFSDFDHYLTAPIHGYASGADYWARASSLPHLVEIKVPTLIINSLDDTFLSDKCYPKDLARDHPLIHLVVTQYGGHVGFVQKLPWKMLWSEQRIKTFLLDELSL